MDRFELEQKIMRVWTITADLKLSKDPYALAVAAVYECLLQDLWDTFESMVSEGKIK